MTFLVIGTNYKYGTIKLIERISFPSDVIYDALSHLKKRKILKGGIILSTCNRVEIYVHTENVEESIEFLEDFISWYKKIEKQEFTPFLYVYENKEALEHLFNVTCGLDSLILGETQILGQVKSAFFASEKVGFTDKFLRKIFYSAISFAKRIHTETQISQGKVSIGSVTFEFIKEHFGDLNEKNVLIIGTGKVATLLLRYLEEEPCNLFISNRTFEKAQSLAEKVGGKPLRFDEILNFLNNIDILITTTSSPTYILRKEDLEGISQNKLHIIDLSVPKNVDPKVKEIKNIELFSLEDLTPIVKKNAEKRRKEAEKIKGIISKEVEKIWEEFIRLEPEPALLL